MISDYYKDREFLQEMYTKSINGEYTVNVLEDIYNSFNNYKGKTFSVGAIEQDDYNRKIILTFNGVVESDIKSKIMNRIKSTVYEFIMGHITDEKLTDHMKRTLQGDIFDCYWIGNTLTVQL